MLKKEKRFGRQIKNKKIHFRKAVMEMKLEQSFSQNVA